MAPVLRKGLMCCLSLRTCALILGSITLIFGFTVRSRRAADVYIKSATVTFTFYLVGNLMTLSMFVVGLDLWLSSGENHLNHTDALSSHTDVRSSHPPDDFFSDLDIEVHGHVDYDGFDDSEAMEELLKNAPHFAMVVLWLDFILVVLETLSVILLIWGAAKRIAVLLLPWLVMELATTLYDLGFFAYLFLSDVYIAIDLLPIILLPISIYCWLVVFSLYQECRETAAMNASMPLSMSALEAGQRGQSQAQACTVPYGRMAAG